MYVLSVGIFFAMVTVMNNCDPIMDFWGVSHVTINNIAQESHTNGYANVRWNVSHSLSSRFPIASNTKLFTAVATYQLHENGILNVYDPINNYLDESDFIKFGFPNITKWCPMVYNEQNSVNHKNQKICQNITFVEALSMSSGIIPILDCPWIHYNKSSVFIKYCLQFCFDHYIPYQGTMSYYVSQFINNPLTFVPGTQYQYSNMNFILVGYIIEKLTQQTFSQYVYQNILSIYNLNNTYYDPWDGQYGINYQRVDEYYLFKSKDILLNKGIRNMNGITTTHTTILNSNNQSSVASIISVGWCAPYQNLATLTTAGAMVSTNIDMHTWYSSLFNFSMQVPKVFNDSKTRKLLLKPHTFVKQQLNGDLVYYAQGVYVTFANGSQTSIDDIKEIYYLGETECCATAIKMIPNVSLVVSAFSNAPNMYVNDGINGLNQLRYVTPNSVCQNLLNRSDILYDTGAASLHAEELLVKYTQLFY